MSSETNKVAMVHSESTPQHVNTATAINVRNTVEFDDPHKAAIESNPEHARRPPLTTLLAIWSLALSTPGTITLPIVVIPSILLTIGTDLNDTVNVAWIASAWAICSSVTCCVAGRVSDIFGRRYVILSGEGIGIVGAIIAGCAKDLPTAIAGSALLGVSCGLILTIWAAIPELVPFRFRGLSLAFIELNVCVPWVPVAVLLGNVISQHATWRWLYYISAIYSAISFTGTAVFYFPPARPRNDLSKTRIQEFAELDFVGLGLYSAGLTILLIGLSWAGGVGHPWRSASVIAPITLGALLLIGCFLYDWMVVSDDKALFPFHLFKQFREFTVLLVVVFVAGMVYYSMSSLIPQATFYMFSTYATQIGIISLPNGFGQLFCACVMPTVLHFTRHPKAHIIAAIFIQGFFTAILAYAVPNHRAAWMAYQFFAQGCFSWIAVAVIVNIGLHVRHSDLGLACGLIGTFRAAGGSVGDAIYATILKGLVNSELPKRIAVAATSLGYDSSNLAALIPAAIANAVGVPDAFAGIPGVNPAIEVATLQACRDAYGYAYKRVFWATIPFSVLALAAAFLVSDSSKYFTNHTAVLLEKRTIRGTTEPANEKNDNETAIPSAEHLD